MLTPLVICAYQTHQTVLVCSPKGSVQATNHTRNHQVSLGLCEPNTRPCTVSACLKPAWTTPPSWPKSVWATNHPLSSSLASATNLASSLSPACWQRRRRPLDHHCPRHPRSPQPAGSGVGAPWTIAVRRRPPRARRALAGHAVVRGRAQPPRHAPGVGGPSNPPRAPSRRPPRDPVPRWRRGRRRCGYRPIGSLQIRASVSSSPASATIWHPRSPHPTGGGAPWTIVVPPTPTRPDPRCGLCGRRRRPPQARRALASHAVVRGGAQPPRRAPRG